MIDANHANLKPLPFQHEFVRGDDPRMCLAGAKGAGKTHALFLAALRGFQTHGYRAVIVNVADYFTPWVKQFEMLLFPTISDLQLLKASKKGLYAEYALENGGTIELFGNMEVEGGADFVGIDCANDIGDRDVRVLEKAVRDSGRFRTTIATGGFASLYGRICRAPSHLPQDHVPLAEDVMLIIARASAATFFGPMWDGMSAAHREEAAQDALKVLRRQQVETKQEFIRSVKIFEAGYRTANQMENPNAELEYALRLQVHADAKQRAQLRGDG